jgi:selenocysteine lyase/cysteine desulfurase
MARPVRLAVAPARPQRRRDAVIGAGVELPCVDGRMRRYVDLDHAASTAALAGVWEAVEGFLPWYSSVHRGSGLKSQIATEAFERARADVARFASARRDDVVVFVRNTTEAINVLAAALPEATRVLSTAAEHHANMLPWRRHDVTVLPVTDSPAELLEHCERSLGAARPRYGLLAVTGASNVTGEVWPLAELAALARRYGAELLVDAAQLAPHRPIDMAATGIDYLALSGHKLYAPFGAGALIGRPGRLAHGEPLVRGGGAVELVTLDDVIWAGAPDRYEAGSPNVIGAVALAAACRILSDLGMERIAARERALLARLVHGLAEIPTVRSLRLWNDPEIDRVGIATFNLDGYRHPLLAAILSAEYAIGVRHGCFCAHPLITRLLAVPDHQAARYHAELRAGRKPALPGAVRCSLGLDSTTDDIDRLLRALQRIAVGGPQTSYRYRADRDEYQPEWVRGLPPSIAARISSAD